MATTNSVTGDKIKSKPNSQQYRDNYDKIDFSKKKKPKVSHVIRSN